MRFLGEIVSLIVFAMVMRSVVVSAWRVLGGGATVRNPAYRPDTASEAQPMRTSGELHKDPVCGTFVPASTAWTRQVNGATAFFCSAECRDRYQPERSGSRTWRSDTTVRG